MKIVVDNPESNRLGIGLTESEVSDTIAKSGYPLQTIVERILRKNGLETQQEWTYIDKEKQPNTERNIDIIAGRFLGDPEKERNLKVLPMLDLLVQCKRSDLPYLFFLIDSPPEWYDVPFCTGTKKDEIEIKTNTRNKFLPISLHSALDLDRLSFSNGEIRRCMSFTKCVRNPKLTVMGEEPFNDIVLPLVKAAHHFKEVRAKPPKRARTYDCHLVVCAAVIDAPMIAVSVKDTSNELIAMPWVRVSRNIVSESDIYWGEEKEIYIDVVHKDYLETYLKMHLFPFSEEFGKRVLRHQHELFTCKGQVVDGEEKYYEGKELEKELSPLKKPRK